MTGNHPIIFTFSFLGIKTRDQIKSQSSRWSHAFKGLAAEQVGRAQPQDGPGLQFQGQWGQDGCFRLQPGLQPCWSHRMPAPGLCDAAWGWWSKEGRWLLSVLFKEQLHVRVTKQGHRQASHRCKRYFKQQWRLLTSCSRRDNFSKQKTRHWVWKDSVELNYPGPGVLSFLVVLKPNQNLPYKALPQAVPGSLGKWSWWR